MDYSVEEYIKKINSEKSIITKAKYLRFLHIDKQIRTKDIAQMLGLKPSYICHLYRLNRLPEYIIDGYYNKTITKSALFILSRLKTSDQMLQAYEEVLQNNLTPSQIEEIVRKMKHGIDSTGERISEEEKKTIIQAVESKYQNTKMKISQTRIRGKMTIVTRGGYKKTTEIMRKLCSSLMKEE